MEESQTRFRIVRRLWRDGIHEDNRAADVETIARFAVHDSAQGQAKELLCDEMAPNADCPVRWVVAGEAVTLRHDEAAVARYLRRHGSEEDELPWDLRDVLDDEQPTAESETDAEVSDTLQ